MGYRLRLGRIPKAEKEKYDKFNSEQEVKEFFAESNMDHSPHRPPNHKELMELGKYVNYTDLPHKRFYNFDLDENDFVIVGRDFLLGLIESYRSSVSDFYEELEKEIDNGNSARSEFLIKEKSMEWSNKYYNTLKTDDIDTDEDIDGHLTRSWKYEYAIFNLLFILHTFDWENDFLIYSGW